MAANEGWYVWGDALGGEGTVGAEILPMARAIEQAVEYLTDPPQRGHTEQFIYRLVPMKRIVLGDVTVEDIA